MACTAPVGTISMGDWTIEVPCGYQFGGKSAMFDIVSYVITAILFIGILLSLLFLLIGAIKWITSGGDKEGAAKAKATVSASLIGLILLFFSYFIVTVLSNFFGISF